MFAKIRKEVFKNTLSEPSIYMLLTNVFPYTLSNHPLYHLFTKSWKGVTDPFDCG